MTPMQMARWTKSSSRNSSKRKSSIIKLRKNFQTICSKADMIWTRMVLLLRVKWRSILLDRSKLKKTKKKAMLILMILMVHRLLMIKLMTMARMMPLKLQRKRLLIKLNRANMLNQLSRNLNKPELLLRLRVKLMTQLRTQPIQANLKTMLIQKQSLSNAQDSQKKSTAIVTVTALKNQHGADVRPQ